jgi:uncharacterized protein YwlG (UPF0340 family)
MGYNTTIVVYNDALGAIENDPNFGKNLGRAIRQVTGAEGRHVDVAAGNHANAAMVVETHHADNTALVTVAGNLGIKHLEIGGWNHHEPAGQERVLRRWADALGFELVPKDKPGR